MCLSFATSVYNIDKHICMRGPTRRILSKSFLIVLQVFIEEMGNGSGHAPHTRTCVGGTVFEVLRLAPQLDFIILLLVCLVAFRHINIRSSRLRRIACKVCFILCSMVYSLSTSIHWACSRGRFRVLRSSLSMLAQVFRTR